MDSSSLMRAFTGTISNLVSPLALAFAVSAYAEVPAPYAVAANQFVTVTVGITTFSDFFGTDYSEDSMVVPIIGNGNFGLFPNALPFTFAEMKANSTLTFGGGRLDFQLLCLPLIGCQNLTVDLGNTTATMVANTGAAIFSTGRADFGTTWNLRGNYISTTSQGSSPGLLDTTSVAPFGTTFIFDSTGFIANQLTIGAIEGDLDPSSLPAGVTGRIRTTVSFGTTFLEGPYFAPPPSCGTGEPCNTPHASSGCADSYCCALVCGLDPNCCNNSWDSLCVNTAVQQCNLTPENDQCNSARPLGFGRYPFTTLNTNTDGPPLITECADPGSGGLFTNDVWFRVVPPVNGGLAVSTCNHAGFDTSIVIYGSCGGVPLGCNDNDSVCNGGTSRLVVPCIAGELYLIRVGGKGQTGTGEIDIALADPTPIPSGLAVQWPASQGGNDHWYAVYALDGSKTFQEANAIANGFGGYLATVTSEAENAFITARATSTNRGGPTLFGLVQALGSAEPSGGWGWSNDESLIYTNWNPGEPNNIGGENWGVILSNGKWNDERDSFGNVLIEFNSNPNLDTAVWTSAEGGNGKSYSAVILPQRVTWQQAKAYAESLGAKLVSMETQAESQWVYRRFAAFTNMWTMSPYNVGPWAGLSRQSGQWIWESGEPITESPWASGEPNNTGDFGSYYSGNDGPLPGLDDTFDANAHRSMIIEFNQLPCLADLDGDRFVSGSDLTVLMSAWGTDGGSNPVADVNGDGIVDGVDLATVLSGWGPCPN